MLVLLLGGVFVESVDVTDAVVRVKAWTTARRMACPGCGSWSERVHGSCLRGPCVSASVT